MARNLFPRSIHSCMNQDIASYPFVPSRLFAVKPSLFPTPIRDHSQSWYDLLQHISLSRDH